MSFRKSHMPVMTVAGQAKEPSADFKKSSKTVMPDSSEVITDHALSESMFPPMYFEIIAY